MINKNNEGYHDPTAYNGMKEVIKEETEQDKAVNKLIQHIRYISGLAGFEVSGRIIFRHKETGKIFK